MSTQVDDVPMTRPPRDSLFRAVQPGVELRADSGTDEMPTLVGHFAVFNQWTEINSMYEGHFMERFAPGAFKKTLLENRDKVRVLFQHGMDPQVGDKPLGPIQDVGEDERGARYEVPLLDTSYNRDLIPGLKAGLYGASFRFRVVREELDKTPKRSATNPDGLPERTIREAELMEFGPVTFPAYAGASAGVRSLTDEFILKGFARDPERLRALVEFEQATERAVTPEEPAAEAEPAPVEDEERTEDTPDAEERAEDPTDLQAEDEAEKNPAPPTDDAAAEPHLVNGSRATPNQLYGLPPREDQPTWLI